MLFKFKLLYNWWKAEVPSPWMVSFSLQYFDCTVHRPSNSERGLWAHTMLALALTANRWVGFHSELRTYFISERVSLGSASCWNSSVRKQCWPMLLNLNNHQSITHLWNGNFLLYENCFAYVQLYFRLTADRQNTSQLPIPI